MQELGCVVPVIDVPFTRVLEIGRDHGDSLDQRREISRPAQELPAQERFCRHHRVGPAWQTPWLIDNIAASLTPCPIGHIASPRPWLIKIGHAGLVGGGEIEIAGASLQGFLRNGDSGDMSASEGEDVPAEDRCVARLTGSIAPAAAAGILRVANKLDGAVRGGLKAGISGQTKCFANGHRGDRVAVEAGRRRPVTDEEVAVR